MTAGSTVTAAPATQAELRSDPPSGRLPAWAEPLGAWAVTLLALAPVITIALQRAGKPYLPMQDQAVIDLRVRDVLTFSNNTPLVGVYSHFWFNHPGPVVFYLVAPFTWIFGDAAWATLVGFALLQGLAIAWTARLAWKNGGLRWTVVWMVIVALTYVGAGPGVLQRPWNPSVALPFFVLFVLQCWVLARGDPRRLLGLAFVATLLVQTHISYAIPVVVLGGWALFRMALALHRQHRKVVSSEILWPVALLAMMWFPPLALDPLLNNPSNLDRLAHFYITGPSRPSIVGLSQGMRYMATEFRWLPPWLGGPDPANIFTLSPVQTPIGWLVLPIVLVVLAWRTAWRRRRTELQLLAELVALLLVGSVLAISLIQGAPAPYLMYWRLVAGAATVVLTVTIVIEALAAHRWAIIRTAWISVLGLALVVASSSVSHQIASDVGPLWPLEPAAQSLLTQLGHDPHLDQPAIVRPWGVTIGGVAVGLIDQLVREGKPMFVDQWLDFEFGYGRAVLPRQVRWVLTVSENSAVYSLGSTYPYARVVAVSHPLPPGELHQLIELQRHLAAVLARTGESRLNLELGDPLVAIELAHLPGIPRTQLQELAQLNITVHQHGCLCSVIQFPVRDSPIGPQAPPV